MRGLLICFFLNLFVCFTIKAQPVSTAISPAPKAIEYDTSKIVQTASAPFVDRRNINSLNNAVVKTIPPGYYFSSLGFFCQKELQVAKTLRFPVKLRLGSVEYTDEIEGKNQHLP